MIELGNFNPSIFQKWVKRETKNSDSKREPLIELFKELDSWNKGILTF